MSTSPKKRRLFSGLGDDGKTSLLGEGRFSKSDLRFDVLGSLDELSAAIGVVKAHLTEKAGRDDLSEVQRILYRMMTEIAYLDPEKIKIATVSQFSVDQLEGWIDKIGNEVTLPADFILPGDSILSAYIDVARTITRRVERRLNDFKDSGALVNPMILKYINRLSSYFYILEVKNLFNSNCGALTFARK